MYFTAFHCNEAIFFLLNTLSLLSPSVFKHQTTTRSPPVHPQNTHLLRVSLTHRKELMTLACDYNSLWRSPAAPLQKHTQAAVCAETQQTPDLCNNTQSQMWWQKSLMHTHNNNALFRYKIHYTVLHHTERVTSCLVSPTILITAAMHAKHLVLRWLVGGLQQ